MQTTNHLKMGVDAGKAGTIILDKYGEYAAVYNTEAMPWAYIKNNKVESGLWK